jgi:hypothetical protein
MQLQLDEPLSAEFGSPRWSVEYEKHATDGCLIRVNCAATLQEPIIRCISFSESDAELSSAALFPTRPLQWSSVPSACARDPSDYFLADHR